MNIVSIVRVLDVSVRGNDGYEKWLRFLRFVLLKVRILSLIVLNTFSNKSKVSYYVFLKV